MNIHITHKNISRILRELQELKLEEKYNKKWNEAMKKQYFSDDECINTKNELFNKSKNFMKKNYNELIELEAINFIEFEYTRSSFSFKKINYDIFTEEGEGYFPKITSEGKNFLKDYSKILRKLEYDYKDSKFISSIFLGFTGGVLSYIIIELIRKITLFLSLI